MRTLIIYNSLTDDLDFVIVDGDYSELNGAILNSVNSGEKELKASELIFNRETWDFNLTFSKDVKVLESKEFDKVAVITFLP